MFDVRPVVPSDLDLISSHRVAMFSDGGKRSRDELIEMDRNFRRWLHPRLENGDYFGYVVEDNGRAIAGIGLMVLDWPPHPLHPAEDCRGYVLNMFVEPEYRRTGIARNLMERAERAFADRGIRYAILHATTEGSTAYSRMGWYSTSEMGKTLKAANRQK